MIDWIIAGRESLGVFIPIDNHILNPGLFKQCYLADHVQFRPTERRECFGNVKDLQRYSI
jgi:hypothetical protein